MDDLNKIQEYVGSIKQAGLNLMAIINDILDISKIEAGTLEIITAPYSLSSLLNDVIGMIQVKVIEKPILFTVDVDASLPGLLYGDEARIRQILLNLLSNAVKYTHEGFIRFTVKGEHVLKENVIHFGDTASRENDVSSEQDKINLYFEIADSGIGIKEEDLPNLFHSFTRLDMKKNQGVEGTGLGLAITGNICRSMGGDFNVSSNYGEGSVFSVFVPQGIVTEEPLAVVDNPAEKSVLCYEKQPVYAGSIVRTLQNLNVPVTLRTEPEEFFNDITSGNYPFVFVSTDLGEKTRELIKSKKLLSTLVLLADIGELLTRRNTIMISRPVYVVPVANVLNYIAGTEPRKWQGGHFVAPDVRVLVVDDINTNLVVTAGLLSVYQFKVDTCTGGVDAIKMVQREKYDVVFMDHMMPGMDGIEATHCIRALQGDYYKQLPVIALTANALTGMKEMFLSHGFNDYLSKPIEISKLNDVLTEWIPKEKQMQRIDDRSMEEEPVLSGDYLVEGVDIQAGRTRYPEKAYLDVLRSYCIHTPAMLEKLSSLKNGGLSEEKLKEYTLTVHGLKGATYGVCAESAGKQAEALETAARNTDLQFIAANNDLFVEAVGKILNGLKGLFALIAERADTKPRTSKPDPAVLLELADACKHYKNGAMEEALGKLEMYEYESEGELITWLRVQADDLEYEAITERLNGFVTQP